jgi:tetratricopeptide (TPR) repeat protein
MKNTKILLFATSLALLLMACGREADPVPAPQSPTPVPSPTAAAIQTPTDSVISPTATKKPISDPTDPGASCLPSDPGARLAQAAYEDVPDAVLDFLNQGGSPASLESLLYDLGVANQPLAAGTGDLTGDGKEDLVVSVYDPRSPTLPPAGRLIIYLCKNGSYELAHKELSPDFAGAPGIRFLQDLNNDGKAELIISSPSCGASTCFEHIQILAWTGDGFENRLSENTDDLPFPVIDLIEEDGTGVFDLQINAGGYGSLGAGPQRGLERRYKLQEETGFWELAEEVPESSNYRIHVLHDAGAAGGQGDYSEALRLYQRVISDATLDDWADPAREQEDLSAYARLQMFFIYNLIGQPGFARSIYNELVEMYPPESQFHLYVVMADAFQNEFLQGNVSSVCLAVRQVAAEQGVELLSGLGPEAFGYGNPSIKFEDVCPW